MTQITLLEKESTEAIIGAFHEVYNTLGFGFFERVYSLAMERELVARGKTVGREGQIPILYKGTFLTNHRADLSVDERVLVEIQSSEMDPVSTQGRLGTT